MASKAPRTARSNLTNAAGNNVNVGQFETRHLSLAKLSRRLCASPTKIMTALLQLTDWSVDDRASLSKERVVRDKDQFGPFPNDGASTKRDK
jgi:hypothetical protein